MTPAPRLAALPDAPPPAFAPRIGRSARHGGRPTIDGGDPWRVLLTP